MNKLDLQNLSQDQLIEMVLKLESQNSELQKDKLTGFYRREKLSDIQTNKTSFVVALLDINGLKKVNDSQGHSAGDEYILSVCESIKSSIRKTDTVIRQGGDEFLIVFDKCTVEQAKMICKRVGNASCGVGQADTLDEAIEIADKDMYENKRTFYNEMKVAV